MFLNSFILFSKQIFGIYISLCNKVFVHSQIHLPWELLYKIFIPARICCDNIQMIHQLTACPYLLRVCKWYTNSLLARICCEYANDTPTQCLPESVVTLYKWYTNSLLVRICSENTQMIHQLTASPHLLWEYPNDTPTHC